jgi:hypothetical protein
MTSDWLEKIAHIAAALGVAVAGFTYVKHVTDQRIDRSIDLYGLYIQAALDENVSALVRAFQSDSSLTYALDIKDNHSRSLLNIVNNDAEIRKFLSELDSFFYALMVCADKNLCDEQVSRQMFVEPANQIYCLYFPDFDEFERLFGPQGFGEGFKFFATGAWPCPIASTGAQT